MEAVYLFGNCNFVKCYSHYTLDLLVQELVKEEFEEVRKHYSIDEFLEYHITFFESLAPYYLKSLITALEFEDVNQVIYLFNKKYQYENEEKLIIRPLNEDEIFSVFSKLDESKLQNMLLNIY